MSSGLAESHDHCGLGIEIPSAEEEVWRDSVFEGVEWWMFHELEIPEEIEERTTDPLNSSPRSVSTSPKESSSVSPRDSAGEICRDELQGLPDGPLLAPKDTAPVKEWLCEYPNCGRSFTHRYMLNKHQKYHNKLHRCLEPSCLARRVTFSREQDLIRHQSQHNGQRFYCPHSDCSFAIDGAKNGFSRKDNQKRHITNQHRYPSQ